MPWKPAIEVLHLHGTTETTPREERSQINCIPNIKHPTLETYRILPSLDSVWTTIREMAQQVRVAQRMGILRAALTAVGLGILTRILRRNGPWTSATLKSPQPPPQISRPAIRSRSC